VAAWLQTSGSTFVFFEVQFVLRQAYTLILSRQAHLAAFGAPALNVANGHELRELDHGLSCLDVGHDHGGIFRIVTLFDLRVLGPTSLTSDTTSPNTS
jgi:hypothetical protein